MARQRQGFTCAAVVVLTALVGSCDKGEKTSSPSPAPAAGDVVVNSIGMKFVRIPPGTFTMGSPLDEPGRADDETPHAVTISRGFYLGATEVTQDQWQAVMGFNPSEVQGGDLPVSKVSWTAANDFCRKLSEKEGKTCRLPTEAEWEYACRAGTPGTFAGPGGADEMAWHMDNSGEQPQPVARKKPNAWGLYDMHGGVMEWCADWYAREYPVAAVDPAGPAEGTARVGRGGSWANFPRACRSAARANFSPSYALKQLGFRVLMEVGDAPAAETR